MDKIKKSEENDIKYFKSFKKADLIIFILKKETEFQEKLHFHINKNKELTQKIVTQKEMIDKLSSKKEEFVFNINKKIFVEYLTAKGLIRTSMGTIVKENTENIKLKIFDKKNNLHYFYIINKKMIIGVKEYY